MKPFFFRTSDYGTETVTIIDEETLKCAEAGKNYLNPDDFDFLCEAENIEEADKYYWEIEFNDYISGQMAEIYHP